MKKYLILTAFILGILVLTFVLYREIHLLWLRRPATPFLLTLKWQVDLGNSSYESPVYQDDDLVLFPANGVLQNYWYALDASTGQIVWSQEMNSQYNFYRCLTTDYLVVSGPWSLTVLNPQTGNIVWKKDKGEATDCNEKLIFTTGQRGLLTAFDIATGEQLWTGTTPKQNFSSLIYHTKIERIIARESILSGKFYIISPETRMLQHPFEAVGHPPFSAVWEHGVTYLISDEQFFVGGTVLDMNTGEIIHHEERYTPFPPALSSNMIYLSTFEEGVVALDRKTYRVKWVYQPSSLFLKTPLVPVVKPALLNDIGYVIFSDATLRAFDLQTGQELGYWQPADADLWRWPFVCVISPNSNNCSRSAIVGLTAATNTLFVSFGDGKLYAFEE